MRNYSNIEGAAIATAEYLQYDGPLFPFPESLYDEIKTIVNSAKESRTPMHLAIEGYFPEATVEESNNWNGWGFRLEIPNEQFARIEETTYGDRYSKKIAVKVQVGYNDNRHFPINKLGDFNWIKIVKFVNDTIAANVRKEEYDTAKQNAVAMAKKTSLSVNRKHGLVKWVNYGEKPTEGYYQAGPVVLSAAEYGKFRLVFDRDLTAAEAEAIAVIASDIMTGKQKVS